MKYFLIALLTISQLSTCVRLDDAHRKIDVLEQEIDHMGMIMDRMKNDLSLRTR